MIFKCAQPPPLKVYGHHFELKYYHSCPRPKQLTDPCTLLSAAPALQVLYVIEFKKSILSLPSKFNLLCQANGNHRMSSVKHYLNSEIESRF